MVGFGIKTDEPQAGHILACRVNNDVVLIGQSFLQGEERLQVTIGFNAVIGGIPFPSCGLVHGKQKLVIQQSLHVHAIVILGINVNTKDPRMGVKAIPALLLELAAGSNGGKPAFGFVRLGRTVCGHLVIPIPLTDIGDVLRKFQVIVGRCVPCCRSFCGLE